MKRWNAHVWWEKRDYPESTLECYTAEQNNLQRLQNCRYQTSQSQQWVHEMLSLAKEPLLLRALSPKVVNFPFSSEEEAILRAICAVISNFECSFFCMGNYMQLIYHVWLWCTFSRVGKIRKCIFSLHSYFWTWKTAMSPFSAITTGYLCSSKQSR